MTTRRMKSAPEPSATADPDKPLDGRESQLLLIARKLFASNGFDRTSLRDIAEEAKITKAALYYYFPNKDALYERVVLESLETLVNVVSAAVAEQKTPTDRVLAYMRASADFLDGRRDQWLAGSNAFWQGPQNERRQMAIKLRDTYEKMLRQCIMDGIVTGEFRPVDAGMAGRFLLSTLNHLARWHKPGGRLTAHEVMEQFVSMALYGLVATPAKG
jgi:TetR/AcrR family transcriptional regulator, cholesterol catabolism regulator